MLRVFEKSGIVEPKNLISLIYIEWMMVIIKIKNDKTH